MTPTNLNASEMLKAFVEAGNALDELPKVRDALAAAQDDAKTNADLYYAEAAERQRLADELAAARATIAAKEAELAQATFQHQQAQALLGNLRGLLGAEPVVDRAELPGVMVEAESTTEQKDSSVTDPTPTANQTDTGAESPFTSTPLTDTQASPTPAPEVATASPSANPYSPSPVSSEPSPSASPGLTASSGDGSPNATPEPTSADPSKPYTGQGYWRKPDAMEWSDWRAGGGETPYWAANVA